MIDDELMNDPFDSAVQLCGMMVELVLEIERHFVFLGVREGLLPSPRGSRNHALRPEVGARQPDHHPQLQQLL